MVCSNKSNVNEIVQKSKYTIYNYVQINKKRLLILLSKGIKLNSCMS